MRILACRARPLQRHIGPQRTHADLVVEERAFGPLRGPDAAWYRVLAAGAVGILCKKNASISGGEPTTRNDLVDIARVMIDKFPKLRKLTLNTTGITHHRAIPMLTDALEQILLEWGH